MDLLKKLYVLTFLGLLPQKLLSFPFTRFSGASGERIAIKSVGQFFSTYECWSHHSKSKPVWKSDFA